VRPVVVVRGGPPPPLYIVSTRGTPSNVSSFSSLDLTQSPGMFDPASDDPFERRSDDTTRGQPRSESETCAHKKAIHLERLPDSSQRQTSLPSGAPRGPLYGHGSAISTARPYDPRSSCLSADLGGRSLGDQEGRTASGTYCPRRIPHRFPHCPATDDIHPPRVGHTLVALPPRIPPQVLESSREVRCAPFAALWDIGRQPELGWHRTYPGRTESILGTPPFFYARDGKTGPCWRRIGRTFSSRPCVGRDHGPLRQAGPTTRLQGGRNPRHSGVGTMASPFRRTSSHDERLESPAGGPVMTLLGQSAPFAPKHQCFR